VTELWGKYDIGDAAQYGVQRLMAKVVVPDAPPAPHVAQWIDCRDVLASAHDTTRVRGRTTDAPEQVRTLAPESANAEGVALGFVPDEPAELTPTPTAAHTRERPARTEKARRMRR